MSKLGYLIIKKLKKKILKEVTTTLALPLFSMTDLINLGKPTTCLHMSGRCTRVRL